jgi:ubiquinone/menaquinone biosynthesis C-methylase UbiE
MTFWTKNKTDIYIKLYDDFAASLKTKEEVAFLKQIFKKNRKIIEFGCGTGRTLIPLLKSGYEISGFDISKNMIKKAKEKLEKENLHTTIYQKDLINFSISTKFDEAILSQRTLNFIPTAEKQSKALINIAKVLKKEAILVINLMPARPDDFAQVQKALKKTDSSMNSATGNMVEFWENWIPNPMQQTWTFTNEFREGKKKAKTTMKMRVLFEAEMKNLLEICGFKTINIYGNWEKAKYDAKSSDLIFIAKRI